MASSTPAFCPTPAATPLLHQGHTTRPSLTHRRSPHRLITPRVSRCQIPSLPGNVEDLPLERIPSSPSALPAYWARPGVYGVYNAANELQYVAATYNVADAIAAHMREFGDAERVFATRMITVEDASAAPLDMLSENWVLAHVEFGPGLPPGNGDVEPRWREDRVRLDVYFDPRMEGEGAAGVESQIRKIVRENRVVLFMKGTRDAPKCGFSRATMDILQSVLGDDFVCVDCLDELRNTGLRDGIKQFSEWPTIPQLYVAGEFVGGADIVKSMADSGELTTLLNAPPVAT